MAETALKENFKQFRIAYDDRIAANYVPKDGSKVLSTNDYTTAEKTKLAGLQNYSAATTTENGLMTATDKAKLDGLQNYSAATTAVDGLMSAADKTKLNGLQSYSNATTVAGGLMSATDKTKLDALQSYTAATTTTSGLMSAADKAKLDALNGVFSFKGTVANFNALPANAATGDVYNITAAGGTDATGAAIKAGDNVVKTDTGWDVLAGSIDISNLATNAVATTTTNGLMSAADKAKLDNLDAIGGFSADDIIYIFTD